MAIPSTKRLALHDPRVGQTGLLLALATLWLGWRLQNDWLLAVVAGELLLTLVWPRCWYPLAWLWLGVGTLLSGLTSRIILTIVFGLVVLPVGLWRRLWGKDPLRQRALYQSQESVLLKRDHPFTAEDLHHPY